jgi:alpha-N-acetylglucosaminidase
MQFLKVLIVLSIVTLLILSQTESTSPIDTVQGLIKRLIPNHSNLFSLQVIQQQSIDNLDVFEIETTQSKVILRGNNGVSLASALNYYLKYYCFCQVSWGANQLNIPEPFPQISSGTVRVVTPHVYRYYLNTCTHGYSTVWWNFTRWEQEIDWMALNGINMPLMFTGQEYIWQQVYGELNVTDLSEFFTGPAFLPWNRMSNLDSWGGVLPNSWIKDQFQLALKILERQRAFGMMPVLPAFAGHVPKSIKTAYPSAQITQLDEWNGFSGTFYLQQTDPLFQSIGTRFIETMIKYFGTDHFYNADPFNEEVPPSDSPEYLATVGKSVITSMLNADPDAVWVLQGWFISSMRWFWKPPQVSALLGSVPQNQLLVLDLFAELNPMYNETELFYNHSFVWCMLHNFGGRSGLYGILPSVAEKPITAMRESKGLMKGMGLTMEAIEQNPVMYDLATDMMWRNDTVNVDNWISDYAHRRYGVALHEVQIAWKMLQNSVYNCPTKQEGPSASIIAALPDLNITHVSAAVIKIYYNPRHLVQALSHLLQCSSQLEAIDTYRYDLIDVTTQMLSNVALTMYNDLAYAYSKNDIDSLKTAGAELLTIISEMDALLATNKNFLLGIWTTSSRSWGTSKEEQDLMEANARIQITTWGKPDSVLTGYAYKLWSGLVKDFYGYRWKLFIDMLERSLVDHKPFDPKEYAKVVQEFHYNWTHDTNAYPIEEHGNTVLISQVLFHKYRSY